MTSNPILPPPFYQYTREIRVDVQGAGNHTNLLDALAEAQSITPRDVFNRVLITVNQGIYEGNTYDVPDWVEIQGVNTGAQAQTGHGTTFYRNISGAPPASETYFFRLGTGCSVSNLEIVQSVWPANFNAEYALVRCLGSAEFRNCRLIFGGGVGGYVGANRAYTVLKENNGIGGLQIFHDVYFTGQGASCTTVRIAQLNSSGGFYNCQFHAIPLRHLQLDHTNANSITTLWNCRMISDTGQLSASLTRPSLSLIRASGSATKIRLFNTRVELDQRENGGSYEEVHPTPQQTQTSIRAVTKTVAVNTTIDGYTDGTVSCSVGGIQIDMPPLAETVDGQSFIVVNDGTSPVTIDGNGATVNGSATASLGAGARTILQRVGAVWVTVSSGGLSSKSGRVLAGSFSGTPLASTVAFSTAFPDALYTVSLIGEDVRSWSISSQVSGGFAIESNSSVALTGDVSWTATKHGETL